MWQSCAYHLSASKKEKKQAWKDFQPYSASKLLEQKGTVTHCDANFENLITDFLDQNCVKKKRAKSNF